MQVPAWHSAVLELRPVLRAFNDYQKNFSGMKNLLRYFLPAPVISYYGHSASKETVSKNLMLIAFSQHAANI